MSNTAKPDWLKNARVKPQANTTAPKEKVKKKEVAEVLEANGLTLIVDNHEHDKIIDVEADPDDEDLLETKTWAESRTMTLAGASMRKQFVIEFMKDFDGYSAAVRCGASNPQALWRRLRNCGYTQRLISKHMQTWQAAAYVSKDKIAAVLWREANDMMTGTAATRVAAAKELSKMLGFTIDTSINVNIDATKNFVAAPLTKEEFMGLKETFNEDY